MDVHWNRKQLHFAIVHFMDAGVDMMNKNRNDEDLEALRSYFGEEELQRLWKNHNKDARKNFRKKHVRKLIQEGYELLSRTALAKQKRDKSKRNSFGTQREGKQKLMARLEKFLASEDQDLVMICLKEILDKHDRIHRKSNQKSLNNKLALKIIECQRQFYRAFKGQNSFQEGHNSNDAIVIKRHLVGMSAGPGIGRRALGVFLEQEVGEEFYQKCINLRGAIMNPNSTMCSFMVDTK